MFNENIIKPDKKNEILLGQEEIDFFKNYAKGEGYKKSLALARLLNEPYCNVEISEERQSEARKRMEKRSEKELGEIKKMAELGGFEFHTSAIIARAFNKSLRAAEKEGLAEGEVKINVLDNGEHKWYSLDEYKDRLKLGVDNLRTVSVVCNLKGDDENGPNILIRNDMDALQMASGEIRHQCGHNVHCGWAISNLDGLIEYKKKFNKLPFKQVIFVSEANEEANPEAGELISPKELLDSGFNDKYGKIDLAMGAHVVASIPENVARIDELVTHGATDFIFTIKPNDNYDATNDNDLRLVVEEVAYLINKEYQADEPNENFGKRQLVADDDGTTVPPVYVRLTAMQEENENKYDNLAINSLPAKAQYNGKLENISLNTESIQKITDSHVEKWNDLGFKLKGMVNKDKSGSFSIIIDNGEYAHVAMGGPNPRQILGGILHEIGLQSKILSMELPKNIKFGGTMRIRTASYDETSKDVVQNLGIIFKKAVDSLGLNNKIDSKFITQNTVRPTVSDPELVREAKAIFEKAGINISNTTLPHAGAESFAEFERFFDSDKKKKMLYIFIGGMKNEDAERLLKTKDPVDWKYLHHSEAFRVQDSAMPYGLVLSALAIQFAKNWEKAKN